MTMRPLSMTAFAVLTTGVALAGPLQDAITAAGPGGVAEIPAGVYEETVVVPEGTFVVAIDPTNTVIDGGGANVVVELGADAGIVGFTIRNGKSGVYNRGHFIGVFECTITGFTEYGIRIEGGSSALLHNEITGDHKATGIGCLGANPYVAYNLVQSNMVGLLAKMNLMPVVEYNVFRGNDLAIQVEDGAKVILNRNVFDGNGQTIDGQELSPTDMVRAATELELTLLKGGKVDAYRSLMRRIHQEAAMLQPRIQYDLTDRPGRFGLICSFPWSVFTISSVTRDTIIEAYDAYDAETTKAMNAQHVAVHGHPSIAVTNPELVDKASDRYVSEKMFVHPPSLAFQPDGTYVFTRRTNLGRIEVWAPAGFVITSAQPAGEITTERGRHVLRLLANGITDLRVVMTRGVPAP